MLVLLRCICIFCHISSQSRHIVWIELIVILDATLKLMWIKPRLWGTTFSFYNEGPRSCHFLSTDFFFFFSKDISSAEETTVQSTEDTARQSLTASFSLKVTLVWTAYPSVEMFLSHLWLCLVCVCIYIIMHYYSVDCILSGNIFTHSSVNQ